MPQTEKQNGGNVTNLDTVKSRRHRGRKIAVALIILAAAAAVALNWQNLSPEAVVTVVNNLTGNLGGSRFPISYAQGEFCDAAPIGGDIGVLTDSAFIVYSPLGRQLAVRQHGLQNPKIAVCGNKALLYDEGGTQLRVESLYGENLTAAAQYPLIAAAVNASGAFAYTTSSNDYLSELSVCSSSGQPIFKWYSSQARIVAVSLSPNGRRVAALALCADNGDISTSLYIYDVDKQKPDTVRSFDGVFLFSVQYRGANRICAIGDDRTIMFDGSGNTVNTYSYGDETLKTCDNGSDETVLALSRYGVGKESSLVNISADGTVAASRDVDSEIKSVTADGSLIAALTSEGPAWYSSDFKTSGSFKANGDIAKLVCIKNNGYLFGPNEAERQSTGR